MDTVYFKDRQTAQAFNMENAHQYTLRRVNLEDAFLAETGRKTEPQQTNNNSAHSGHSGHSGHSEHSENASHSAHSH